MSTEMRDGHCGRELHDLLDRRLEAAREAELRAHLDRCQQCRHELEALVWVERIAASAERTKLPAGLERSVRALLAREDQPTLPTRLSTGGLPRAKPARRRG